MTRQQTLADYVSDLSLSTKDEAWKYAATRFVSLVKKQPLHVVDVDQLQPNIAREQMPDNVAVCVLVNGVYFPGLSDDLPEGVTITQHDSALSLVKETSLTHIATHVGESTTHIAVADHAVIEQPLYLYHVTMGEAGYHSASLSIAAGKHSIAHIIEHYVGQGNTAASWENHVQTIDVAPSAQLKHYVVQAVEHEDVFTSHGEVTLHTKSHYRLVHFSMGALLARHELHTHIKGEHAESDMKGLFVGRDAQQYEYYLPTTHHSGHSVSHQKVYGVLDDKAQGTFYGKVIVPQDSQHIASHQMNRNVILSDKAQVHSRPELEIYADDVECSHGSATGELDPMALYYLQARGLTKEQAQLMLLDGFMHEIVNAIIEEHLRDLVDREIDTWLRQ